MLNAGPRVYRVAGGETGQRRFVEAAANFPEQCRYVLETLGGGPSGITTNWPANKS
jgi:hypothetical protein